MSKSAPLQGSPFPPPRRRPRRWLTGSSTGPQRQHSRHHATQPPQPHNGLDGPAGRATRRGFRPGRGDIHEDQLLADGERLTGIIDWETARFDHPFWDFDLGEWGTGLWRRRRRDFSALWARGWHAYAQVRGLDTDSRPLETAFRLRHALRLLADPGDPAVVGTLTSSSAQL